MMIVRYFGSKRTRLIGALLAGLLALGAAFWFFGKGSATSSRFLSAPEFELKDDQGRTHALKDYRGKLIILHFWATWCAPCLEELPAFMEFTKQFEGEPIQFIAVSLDKDWKTAHRYLKPELVPKNVASLLDPKSEVPEAFGSFQFPESYLLSPDLKILSKWVGPQEWGGAHWRELLLPLLQAVKANATGGTR